MHYIQEKLFKLITERNISGMTLREIGALINERLPQKVTHHLSQLEKKGFILIDKKNKIISKVKVGEQSGDVFISIPIVGSANCGPERMFAESNVTGFLKVSKGIAPYSGKLFILKAEGDSMNKANIRNGKNIEDGDYVVVDSEQRSPVQGEYVVSVIDEFANIKKFVPDPKNKRIILQSESTKDYLPIFIHEDDKYCVSGKVIDVIKKPNL